MAVAIAAPNSQIWMDPVSFAFVPSPIIDENFTPTLITQFHEDGGVGQYAGSFSLTTSGVQGTITSYMLSYSGVPAVQVSNFSLAVVNGVFFIGDALQGGDHLDLSDLSDQVFSLGGDDLVLGRGGDDILSAGDGNDNVLGGSGNDFIDGGAGADFLSGESGSDTLNGGAGTDTASYASAGSSITARLDLGFGQDDGGAFDTYSSIENVTGSNFADVIVGKSGVANVLIGGLGDDTFVGEGIDTVNGGSGNDVLFGGQSFAGLDLDLNTSSIEIVWGSFVGDVMDGSTATANLTMIGQGLTGGGNADTMLGGSGDDFIYYRAGDVVGGGSGNDWAVATLSASSVTLNMAATGFENAWGSTSGDTLTATGSATTAVIVGDAGNDTLTGGNAGDFLYGFDDNDRLASFIHETV